jgi:hypothetical protein
MYFHFLSWQFFVTAIVFFAVKITAPDFSFYISGKRKRIVPEVFNERTGSIFHSKNATPGARRFVGVK